MQCVNASFSSFHALLPGLRVLSEQTFNPLGSPIFPAAIPDAFEERRQLLLAAATRLKKPFGSRCSHFVAVLFRSAKAYLPFTLHPGDVDSFDCVLKDTLKSVFNVSLNQDQWELASLPIRNSGLGIRRARDISLPAFLASAGGVVD